MNAELQIVSHDMAARMIQAGAVNAAPVVDDGAKAAGAYAAIVKKVGDSLRAFGDAMATHSDRCDEANATYPGQAWHFVGDLNEAQRLLTEALARIGARS